MVFIVIFLMVFAVLIGLHSLSRHIVRQSKIEYPPQGQFFTVEGIRLHYLDKGNGPPLVILHGSASSIHGFVLYLLDFASQRYRVILFDRPGFGNSQPMHEISTIEAQNHLMHTMLEKLNVQKPIIFGHSWSTMQAVDYALTYPEDVGALLLMSPGAFLKSIPIFRVMYWIIQIPILADFILGLFPVFGPPGVEKRLILTFSPIAIPEDFLEAARSVWMRPNSARSFIIDWAPQTFGRSVKGIQKRYSELNVPTVIVCGDLDRISPIENNAVLLQKIIPNCELSIVQGAGHQVYVTNPEAVLNAIDRACARSEQECD